MMVIDTEINNYRQRTKENVVKMFFLKKNRTRRIGPYNWKGINQLQAWLDTVAQTMSQESGICFCLSVLFPPVSFQTHILPAQQWQPIYNISRVHVHWTCSGHMFTPESVIKKMGFSDWLSWVMCPAQVSGNGISPAPQNSMS